jgi:hypothetical protein
MKIERRRNTDFMKRKGNEISPRSEMLSYALAVAEATGVRFGGRVETGG